MSGSQAEVRSSDYRVLVVAPTSYDARVICDVLAADGIAAQACANLQDACVNAEAGAATLVVTEEAYMMERELVRGLLSRQEPWSDIPIVVLTSPSTKNSEANVLNAAGAGNITLLERPLSVRTLLSAARVAIRSRRRQYEVRDLLRQREIDLRNREQDVQRRDEFLAMLAHELRNPLAPIRNAVAIMRLAPPDEDSQARVRDIVERQVVHMGHIIDDLIDVSRIERGKVQLRCEAVELSTALRHAMEACKEIVKSRRHEVMLSLNAEPLWIDADPTRLEQMICNLINNAAKYTPEGGQIRLTAARDGNQAVLSVRDNGRGIEPQFLDNIFELFRQVRTSIDRNEGGLGIGLTLVRKLAALHGGSVSAESAGLGKGSVFTLRFTLRPAPTQQPSADADPGTDRKRRILIIEDNQDSRETLQMMLSMTGHRVETAPDGEAGLRKLLEMEPDLALVDVGLPGLDGYSVARQARAARPKLLTVLVALTGYGQPEDQRRALQAGFNRHLTKPVSAQMLDQVIGGE